VAIAVNLLQHKKPSCNCFGQLHSAPIGWQTLVRNIVLGLIASIVIFNGRDAHALSVLGWTRSLTAASSASLVISSIDLVLLVAVAAFLVQILQQQGRVLLRLEALEQGAGARSLPEETVEEPKIGLPIGETAPEFELSDLEGGRTSLGDLMKREKPVMLLFSHPDCGPCQSLLPDIPNWQSSLEDDFTIVMIAEGSVEANRAKAESFGIGNVLIQEDREVALQYEVRGTPAAVIVAANGVVASYVAHGIDAIRELVGVLFSQKQARLREADTLSVGSPVPDLAFEAVSGEKVALSDLKDKETLLLFWNPQCGFCQRMLPDLQEWEKTAQASAPRLVVLSTGSASDNRAMGLRSTVLSDPQSSAASAFGAHGTPMGILLDKEGRIASRVVAGAEAVFELANKRGSSTYLLDLVLKEA
jgi:methylamine dehydrogenase accessory protein MauD